MTVSTMRPAALVGMAFLAIYVLAVSAVSFVFPMANWDMIAYVANILEASGETPQQIHPQAYELVRQNIGEGDFLILTEDRPYRVRQFADPDAFASMLGFYRVKMLYVELGQVLSQWIDPVVALRAISTGSALAIGAVTAWWLAANRCMTVAPLAVIVLILTGLGSIARLATPDLFSAVFVVAGILLFVGGKDWMAGLAFLVAILIRPDHLALVGVFMVVSVAFRQVSWGAIAAFVLGLVAYVLISRAGEHPGWWIQFWFTNEEYVPTLEGFDPPFSIVVYIKAVIQTLVRSFVEERWMAVLALMIFASAILLRNNFRFERREAVAFTAILLTIPAKFILLPLYPDRFYFAYLLAFGLVLVVVYGRQAKPVFSSDSSPLV